MSVQESRAHQVQMMLPKIKIPAGIKIRAWTKANFEAIQELSSAEGWPTPEQRPEEALAAWRHSWPTLVATDGARVIGFVRALTDGEVTTYIGELLVEPEYRGQGIGRGLLDMCHYLFPHTRFDLLSTDEADQFYKALGFRPFKGYRKSYQ